MNLIVTRPRVDAEALLPRLAARGYTGLLCPLMEIRQRDHVTLPATPLQAVCASSANGLEARIDWAQLLHLDFLAVGPQSAEAARRKGFDNVMVSAGGNLPSLAELARTRLTPHQGALLYLTGSEVAGDLAGMLQAQHVKVERLVVYDAFAVTPPDLETLLAKADGVLLYSPRTAKLWVEAAQKHPRLQSILHFCLSANVAAQLPQFLAKRIARTPDDSGMMELLDQHREAE
jgi:uroporphyrinogen-III synthase